MPIRVAEPNDWKFEFAVDASAPCFGFLPAARFGIGCEHGAPVELQPGTRRGASGTVRYPAAFNKV